MIAPGACPHLWGEGARLTPGINGKRLLALTTYQLELRDTQGYSNRDPCGGRSTCCGDECRWLPSRPRPTASPLARRLWCRCGSRLATTTASTGCSCSIASARRQRSARCPLSVAAFARTRERASARVLANAATNNESVSPSPGTCTRRDSRSVSASNTGPRRPTATTSPAPARANRDGCPSNW